MPSGECSLQGQVPRTQKEMKIDARKQKNRKHAKSSRIRQKKKEEQMEQRVANLNAECARLGVVVEQLKHQGEMLKVHHVVGVFLR